MLIRETDSTVVNVDKLTYAGNLDSLADALDDPRHHFAQADICDAARVRALFAEHRPDAVIHLAAESHVDRSIDGPAAFIQTNVVGTFVMLEEALRYWRDARSRRTDSVPLRARLDGRGVRLARARMATSPRPRRTPRAHRTRRARRRPITSCAPGITRTACPTVTTNCSNNYGPYQFPEKLIPLMIQNARDRTASAGLRTGENVRDWLYVDDHARALLLVAGARDDRARRTTIGGGNERRNIDVVRAICALARRARAGCVVRAPRAS